MSEKVQKTGQELPTLQEGQEFLKVVPFKRVETKTGYKVPKPTPIKEGGKPYEEKDGGAIFLAEEYRVFDPKDPKGVTKHYSPFKKTALFYVEKQDIEVFEKAVKEEIIQPGFISTFESYEPFFEGQYPTRTDAQGRDIYKVSKVTEFDESEYING